MSPMELIFMSVAGIRDVSQLVLSSAIFKRKVMTEA